MFAVVLVTPLDSMDTRWKNLYRMFILGSGQHENVSCIFSSGHVFTEKLK